MALLVVAVMSPKVALLSNPTFDHEIVLGKAIDLRYYHLIVIVHLIYFMLNFSSIA